MPSPIAFIIPALNEEAALSPKLDGLRAALDAAACADADILVGTGARRVEDLMDHRKVRTILPALG